MAVFMISYDLMAPTNNREKVEESIKALGSWCKYVSTTFLVSTSSDATAVQNAATKHLDSNDSMVICEVVKPVLGWLTEKQWTWIKQNL